LKVLLNGNRCELSHEIKSAMVCERMNWTYGEYSSQPNWFIEILMLKWFIENEINNKK